MGDSLHHRGVDGGGPRDGTPSRLSIGSGWASTPGHTWATEGTPSYTPSSLSRDSSMSVGGAHCPAAGNSSSRNLVDSISRYQLPAAHHPPPRASSSTGHYSSNSLASSSSNIHHRPHFRSTSPYEKKLETCS